MHKNNLTTNNKGCKIEPYLAAKCRQLYFSALSDYSVHVEACSIKPTTILFNIVKMPAISLMRKRKIEQTK